MKLQRAMLTAAVIATLLAVKVARPAMAQSRPTTVELANDQVLLRVDTAGTIIELTNRLTGHTYLGVQARLRGGSSIERATATIGPATPWTLKSSPTAKRPECAEKQTRW